MSARGLSFACGALALLVAPVAHAAPGDATRLEYARSASAQRCPDRTALREAVTKRLGYDPFFPVARQAVVVEITDDGKALSAAMRLLDESGIIRGGQQLHAPREHCDELVAALALAISIALDPSSALETRAAPEPPKEADDEKPGAEDVDQPEVERPPLNTQPMPVTPRPSRTTATPRAEKLRFAARATGFVALGTAPAPGLGAMLGASARSGFWSLSLELGGQLPGSTAATGGGRARASELAAALSPCVMLGMLSGCALAKLSLLRTEGVGVENSRRQNTLQFGLGARAELAPRLSKRVSLLLNAEVLKPLLPVTLRLRDENVWHSPLVSVAFGLGLSFDFS